MNCTYDRNKYPEQQWKKCKIKYCTYFMPNCNTDNIAPEESVTFTPMECIKQGYFENRCATFSSFNGSYTKYQEGDIVIAKVSPCFENGNIALEPGQYRFYLDLNDWENPTCSLSTADYGQPVE